MTRKAQSGPTTHKPRQPKIKTDRAAADVVAAAPSKLDTVITLLRRSDGATLDEIVAATGWQRHSARGALAGAVKKRLGVAVISEKIEGVRRYRAAPEVA